MPWVPIADSSAAFLEFSSDEAELVGSAVTASGDAFPEWALNTYNNAVRLRITAQSYSTSQAGADPCSFDWSEGQQANEAVDQTAEFLPSSFEIDMSDEVSQLLYTPSSFEGGTTESFEFLIEVWEEGPEPPASTNRPYVIRGTHRAYMGGDAPQRTHIRNETGKHDLTAYGELTVEVSAPDGQRPRLTLNAMGDADGLLQFTITANGARTRLWPGTFNLFAYGDEQVIYTGLLEVLA